MYQGSLKVSGSVHAQGLKFLQRCGTFGFMTEANPTWTPEVCNTNAFWALTLRFRFFQVDPICTGKCHRFCELAVAKPSADWQNPRPEEPG